MNPIRIGGIPVARFLKEMSEYPKLAKVAFSEYMIFSDNLYKNYGLSQSIKILKEINTRSRHYVAGYPKGDYQFSGIWFKVCRKSYLPKKMRNLKLYLDQEPNMALTIPNIVYTLYDKPNYDISTIEKEGETSLTVEENREFEQYCKFGTPKLKPAKVNHLFTCKGGPNGPSAVSHAQDLVAILLTTFPRPYEEIVRTIYGPDSWLEKSFHEFSKDLLAYNSKVSFKKEQKSPLNAKLEFISSPAGKTRIVYVGNWWIQAALLPLHESLMNRFATMRGDATWDQTNGIEQIRKWSANKEKLFSFDLTAATDRWPIWHQEIIVKHCFSEDIKDVWKFLVTRIPPYSKFHDRYIFYKCGQPMGLFTSWAVLNMSHHMVLRYLCWKYKLPNKYMILGDDIVISGSDLAGHYKEYMTKLGVTINDKKSLINKEGKPSSAEFARHIVKDGLNVGCVSPNVLGELIANRNYSMSYELIRELKDKYGSFVFVSESYTLLSKRLYRFLGTKCFQSIHCTLSLPLDDLNMPVIRVTDEQLSVVPDNMVRFDSPWKGLDVRGVAAGIQQKWMIQNNQRMVQLIELADALNKPDNSVYQGHLLELKSHPIRLVLKSINDEIAESMWTVLRGKRLTPTQITTSIDLLISVLSKGLTYRQWRERTIDRFRNISKYNNQLNKDMWADYRAVLKVKEELGFDKDPWSSFGATSWEDLEAATQMLESPEGMYDHMDSYLDPDQF